VNNKKVLRIIDVNINRAQEGLRVAEDVMRFILNDSGATSRLKQLRHKIYKILESSKVTKSSLCNWRDTDKDYQKDFSNLEKRKCWQDIFFANIQRSKESLRVLEEFFKLEDQKTGENFKALRFRLYKQEKNIVDRYFK